MNNWTGANLRHDVLTAAEIDHGIAVQSVAGACAAYIYLLQRRIPEATIQRVMSSPSERRPMGAVGSAPPAR